VSSSQLSKKIIAARIPQFKLDLSVSFEECFCEEKICVQYLESKTLIVCMLRPVARRRLVETDNPSVCATVCWKVCPSAIALYCMCVRVIKCACVSNC
jgi:hypothetical protein